MLLLLVVLTFIKRLVFLKVEYNSVQHGAFTQSYGMLYNKKGNASNSAFPFFYLDFKIKNLSGKIKRKVEISEQMTLSIHKILDLN